MLYTVGEPSQFLIQERIYLAFQAEDAARRAYLNTLIREGGRCRYCGREVSDFRLTVSPGVCSLAPCQRRAARGEPGKVLVIMCSKPTGRPKGR